MHTCPGCYFPNEASDKIHSPTPESDKETEPGEQEDPAISVEWVQRGNRSGFVIDWIDLWGLP